MRRSATLPSQKQRGIPFACIKSSVAAIGRREPNFQATRPRRVA